MSCRQMVAAYDVWRAEYLKDSQAPVAKDTP